MCHAVILYNSSRRRRQGLHQLAGSAGLFAIPRPPIRLEACFSQADRHHGKKQVNVGVESVGLLDCWRWLEDGDWRVRAQSRTRGHDAQLFVQRTSLLCEMVGGVMVLKGDRC